MGVYKGESFSQEEWDQKNINSATGKPFGQAGEEAVQGKAQEWRNQGSPMPGTKEPEDIRSLGQQLIDWAGSPQGNAVLGGLGLAAVSGYGLSRRKTTPETPKAEPYVAPSYDYETTAREVPETKSLPQPSTPVAQTAPAPEPMPTAPTGAPAEPPKFTVAGQVQPQMQYGATNTTAPAGALTPINPVTPPATTEPAPVQPLTDKQRLEKARADLAEHKLEEARKESAAKAAEKDAEKLSKTQGNVDPIVKMEQSSVRAKEEKAAEAAVRATVKTNPPIVEGAAAPKSAPPAAPVNAPTTTPELNQAPTSSTNPPEGYIANYMEGKKKKSGAIEYKNKQGSDVLGKGGWNWYQGQMGPEAEKNWLQTFGRTNQSYADVQQAIKEGRLKGPEVVEGRGGSFGREPIVPNYIKGSASTEMLARTGLGALGIMPVAQKIKEGDYKGALNELIPAMAMISPALSLAASPLYTSEEEIATLKKAEQGRKVGGGRGIAPPSDYKR